MKPLLSICLPTYNGAFWLEQQLGSLIPQVTSLGSEVELCLSDDGSTDETGALLDRFGNNHPMKLIRNERRRGGIYNFHTVIAEMSSGEYIWLIGQDDLVVEGALKRILKTIKDHSELDIFYLNYFFRKNVHDAHPEKLVEVTKDFAVPRWQDLVSESGWLGTGMAVNVIRRNLWLRYWRENPPGVDFAIPESAHPQCNPHSYLIADYCLNRPAYFVAEPVMVLTAGSAVWHESRIFVFEKHYPLLLKYFRKRGLSPKAYRYHSRWVYERAMTALTEHLNTSPESSPKILLPFLRDFGSESLAWKAAIGAWLHSERTRRLKRWLKT